MEKKPIYVAFSNLKGGVEKSVFASSLASITHYLHGKDVVLVDCDYPQFSIKALRDRDMDIVNGNKFLQEKLVNQYNVIKKKAYPILTSQPAEAITSIENYIKQCGKNIDIVFFDMPGNVESQGIITSLLNFDYIFCPVTADRMVMQSSLAFIATLLKIKTMQQNIKLKDIYLFWNSISSKENKELLNVYLKIIKELDLKSLETRIPNTVKYKKEVSPQNKKFFRSTLFPPDDSMADESKIYKLSNEIYKIIEL